MCTQCWLVVSYRCFGATCRFHFQGSWCLTLGDGIDRLSQNVGKRLPVNLCNIPEEHKPHVHCGRSLKTGRCLHREILYGCEAGTHTVSWKPYTEHVLGQRDEQDNQTQKRWSSRWWRKVYNEELCNCTVHCKSRKTYSMHWEMINV